MSVKAEVVKKIGATIYPAGPRGPAGPAGPAGAPGPRGTPGKTPEKGVDYYTEEDKKEMVNAVLAALPNGDEVVY